MSSLFFTPAPGVAGSGIVTVTGNSGGAISPDGSNNLGFVGAGNIDIAGAGNGLTASLTGLTNGTLLLANSASTVTGKSFGSASAPSTVVARDANANIFANNCVSATSLVASAGATTILTAASARIQQLTGTLTQTFQLPDATTLSLGCTFDISNNSTRTLAITNNGSANLASLGAGAAARFICSSIATANGTWDIRGLVPSNASFSTASLTVPGLISTPNINITGSSSGTISLLGQANAGTYNFNLPTTAGTAQQLLASGGGGANPMLWANSNSLGTQPLIQTQTAANVAAITFTNIGSSNSYKLVYSNVQPISSGAILLCQVSADNGATWSTSTYRSGLQIAAINNTGGNQSTGSGFMLGYSIGNANANQFVNGTATFFQFNAATLAYSSVIGSGYDTFNNDTDMFFGSGSTGITGANAIRILFSTGNINTGTFSLYNQAQ